jgi:FecR protein
MFRSLKAITLLLAVVCMAAAPNHAVAGDPSAWLVQSLSGTADLKVPGKDWQRLADGQEIDVGATVRTAKDGRVVLSRDDERVTIAAASSFEIKPASNGMLTRIFQKAGTLMFKVHKLPNKHFEVGTPYLVAVVKGTTFTVSVDANGSAVHVTEGLVEVSSLSGPEKLLLPAGKTGSIGARPGSKLQSGAVTPDKGSDSGKSSGKKAKGPAINETIQSAALDIEETSNGLFRNDPKGTLKPPAAVDNTVGSALGEVLGGGNGTGGGGASGGGASGGLGGTVGGVADSLGGAVSGLSSGLGGAVSGLSSGLGGAVSGLSSGVGGAIGGGVGGAVSGVGGSVGGAVSGVGGSVGGVVGGVGGLLGGLLGGSS